MEIQQINIKKVVPNSGQIDGLPANPRQWTKAEMEYLKKSLLETPELFEARGIIVVPHGGEYIALGGNMRLAASKELKFKEVPCIVLPSGLPVAKLKQIVVKDNGSFGQWDYDMLANEWDDLPLTEWGVPAWETEPPQDATSAEAKEDDFDENTETISVRCKPGDIWELGEHHLMCGDSINLDDVKRLMGGGGM